MLGGDLEVHRLGFGAMRITGPGIWGEPRNPEVQGGRRGARSRREINLIDTADSYGPEVSERLIADALYPYPDDLVIATKGGLTRSGPNHMAPQRAGRSISRRGVRRQSVAAPARADRALSTPSLSTPRCRWRNRSEHSSSCREEGKIASHRLCRTFPSTSSRRALHAHTNRLGPEPLQPQQSLPTTTNWRNARANESRFSPGTRLSTGTLAYPATHLLANDMGRAHGATLSSGRARVAAARSPVMLPIPGPARSRTSRRTSRRATARAR